MSKVYARQPLVEAPRLRENSNETWDGPGLSRVTAQVVYGQIGGIGGCCPAPQIHQEQNLASFLGATRTREAKLLQPAKKKALGEHIERCTKGAEPTRATRITLASSWDRWAWMMRDDEGLPVQHW